MSNEIPGQLAPEWYLPFNAYLHPKTQIIAADNLLFVSTANGLYAVNPVSGDVVWVYPTSLPLGQAPTYHQGVLYVGGLDRQIHAIRARPTNTRRDPATGATINQDVVWLSPPAGAGIETNPLVAGSTVFAGSRDGTFYAYNLNDGQIKWQYQTQGPITYSAAYNPNTQVVYVASNDMHAYAFQAGTGSLVWKSAKLPGAGFFSYYPVLYTHPSTSQNYVIFSGSMNYRLESPEWEPDIGTEMLTTMELKEIFPNHETITRGTLLDNPGTTPGNWATGTVTLNASKIAQYLETKPWRRTYFVLYAQTGKEYTFDSDNDGKPEYAPVSWSGVTHSGNRYPPIIGSDGVLYQHTLYASDQYIAAGGISGWKFGTPTISLVTSDWQAVDEPHAWSGGGNLIYWNLCCDREGGAFDITKPRTQSDREWMYFAYNLPNLIPSYDEKYSDSSGWGVFDRQGSHTGVYGLHTTTQNPPIPYLNRVFMHKGNALIAWSTARTTPQRKPTAPIIAATRKPELLSDSHLRSRLADEVTKIINAGHLRPGYHVTGIFDSRGQFTRLGDYLIDYFHSPADTISILLRALPHLPTELQNQVRTYIQTEFANYSPLQYAHIGWDSGSSREWADLPPELTPQFSSLSRLTSSNPFEYGNGGGWWRFPPHHLYATFLYAKSFGNASTLLTTAQSKLQAPPDDTYLSQNPHILNAYIAGYQGYLGLQQLAGQPESASHRQTLNRLLNLRVNTFTIESSESSISYPRTFNLAKNFLYLTPELAQYLRQHAAAKVTQALTRYQALAPFWFISRFDATYAEGTMHHLYDTHTLFQAKAQILQASREELSALVDAPAFARGDLFYIDNLITTLESQPTVTPNPSPSPKPLSYDQDTDVDFLDFTFFGPQLSLTNCSFNFTGDCNITIFDFNRLLTHIF